MGAQVSPAAGGRGAPNQPRAAGEQDPAWTDTQSSGGFKHRMGLNRRPNDPSEVRNRYRGSLSSLGPKVLFGEDAFSTDDHMQRGTECWGWGGGGWKAKGH